MKTHYLIYRRPFGYQRSPSAFETVNPGAGRALVLPQGMLAYDPSPIL